MTDLAESAAPVASLAEAKTVAAAALADTATPTSQRPGAALLELSSGETVDRYIVLARVGAGGMGVVHAAYDPELDRKVALKLLPTRSDEADARARLLREAQAMARLQHPNVVAVFDAGAIAGHVWVAMEFVDGQVLSAWSAAARRSWRDVLEVMCAAGRGLAAVHAAALVHRDVKPDNVMVGGDGRVRLMDFGLARSGGPEPASTRPGRSDRIDDTQAGAIFGTPAYMAPEQFAGLPADARTDQFGWCATCWEALYGQRPFAGDDMIELATAVTAGAIRPPPPSPVPRWLRRALERGLQPDPQARFASMDALLAELAHGQSRAQRWLQRLALTAAVAGAAGVYGARQLESARAVAACDAAGGALERVWNDDVHARMSAAFTRASPGLADIAASRTTAWLDRYVADWQQIRVTACREATIEHAHALDVAAGVAACLDERRIDLEAVVGVLVEADAEVVQRAAHLVSGLTPASTCPLEARIVRTPSSLADAGLRTRTGELRRRLVRAVALEDTGNFAEGLAAARDVLFEAERFGLHALRAEAQMRIGNLHERRGDFAAAERALEDAVWIASGAGHDETVAEAASTLAFTVSYRLGRHEDALRWARLSQAALHRLGAEDSLRAARLYSVLGTVHRLRGDLERARELSLRALAIRESLLGSEHPDVARSLNTLGNVALADGEYDLAIQYHERALAIRGNAYGVDSHDVATSMKNLGDVHLARGAADDAFYYHNDALALRERLLGPSHPDVASALIDLGRTHRARRDDRAARAAFIRAAELRERSAVRPLVVAEAWTHVGEVDLALGDVDAAVVALERALDLQGASGPPSPQRAATLAALAEALRARGDITRADATARLADDEAARAHRDRG
ncbi:tetratricopeptide repeat protein [Nannocystis pusilla]|uniref:Serine/threonine-protein kinase n=1 Tax=Nannocystis pusilla TaxID=889268 RepID=A0ABS7TM70_9BACT|nr:serine/threonine-protein kinase [Nannocystis pusilla]